MNQFQTFFRSYQFSNGLRLTWAIVFPLLLGIIFNLLPIATAVGIGALCVGLSDSPGNWTEKAKGLLGGSILNAVCAFGIAYFVQWPFFGLIYLGIVTFIAALLAIFGNRSTLIGNSVLISISLGLGFGENSHELFQLSLAMLGGGLWYSLNSLLLWQIKPYATIEKILGESYVLMAKYISLKAHLFNTPTSIKTTEKLFLLQTEIDHKQDEIRKLLLSQRSAMQGATPHGRSLILLLRFSVDIFEKATATHINYTTLEKHFKDTPLPKELEKLFNRVGDNLLTLGKHIQKRKPLENIISLDKEFDDIQILFENLRDDKNRTISISLFAEVKNIIRNFGRIDRLTKETTEFTNWKNLKDRSHTDGLRLPSFLSPPEQGRLIDNLTFSSSHFRHALKISIAMMLGYCCAIFLEIDRGYWIWLSISVIMKPSFAITKQRMIARIVGTSIGIIIASIVMWSTSNPFLYLIVLIPLGIGTFGTLAKNYRLGMTLLTPFVLLLIAISTPTTFEISIFRILDTTVGGLIAFIVSFIILPEFEANKIKTKMSGALKANSLYFKEVAIVYTGEVVLDINSYKLARKNAQLANANLAMSFQTMLNDPKNSQIPSSDLYEFIAAIRMLFSHTATLSANVERLSKKYQYKELLTFIKNTCDIMKDLSNSLDKNEYKLSADYHYELPESLIKETEELEKQREMELKKGIKDSPNIKKLSDLVLISNQFKRIGKNVICLKQYTSNFLRILN